MIAIFRLRTISVYRYIGRVKLLTTVQAAETLGLSARRIRALIAAGKLPAQKLGRDYLIEDRSLRSVRVYRKAGRPRVESKSGKKRR
jgi:excisionase family DNA binding protein